MYAFFSDPIGENLTLYGHTATGIPLTERFLWKGEKSLLVVTGFCRNDHALSLESERWISALESAEKKGDSFLGFDLKSLKKKSKIRIVSRLDPNTEKIHRNGMNKSKNSIVTDTFSTNQIYNKRGVDLNRNFGSDWLKLRKDPLHAAHCGPFPESESEVASFTAHVRRNPPDAALILRRGKRGLFYPLQATDGELREAQFLARYATLPLFPLKDGAGTALQWLTDRGVKALELREEGEEIPYLQKFITMCVALL